MSAPVRAALVAVGDELLSGAIGDANSAWIARALGRVGLAVESVEIASDDEPAVAAAVVRALERAELVTVTGGLGPTLDDVTRHGIARALALELVEDAGAVAELTAWFAQRGVVMSDTNRRQALFPRGAAILRNRAGTAPGFRVERDGRAVLALPGPPRELTVVWNDEVEPWLRARGWGREPIPERHFYLFGIPESRFAERVGPWMAREAEPRMGCTVRDGVLTAALRAGGRDAAAVATLEARAAEFRARFAAEIYSESEWELERALGEALIASATRVTLAESCTGGLAAALLTGVPGISAVFAQAFVTYADAAKESALSVPRELLARHGAVSREVVEAMALGAARATGARLSLAVTGIAGPSGGTPEKPVGLVWFASAFDGEVASLERRFPPSDRELVRRSAARTALFLGWKRLADAGLARPRRAH